LTLWGFGFLLNVTVLKYKKELVVFLTNREFNSKSPLEALLRNQKNTYEGKAAVSKTVGDA
jgi:hypothetical protein